MELSAGVLRHLGYLYFTGDQTKDTGPLIKGITQWTEYFDFNWQTILGKGEEAFRETYVVHIDYVDLLNTDVPGGVEVFKHNICSKPAFLLSCMSAGLHISACKRFGRNSLIDKHLDSRNAGGDVSDTSASSVSLDAAGATDMQCKRSDIATTLLGNGLCKHVFFMDVLPQYVTIRLQNFFPRSPFSVLRSHAIGCLVSIAGQVIRISTTTPMIISGMFTCAKCGCNFFKKFKDGLFEYPSRCFTEGCTWRASHFQRHCVQTTSSQVVRIQEDSRMDTNASVRYGDSAVGTYVDVELTGDLVDQCSPGNLVDIVGIVDATPCLVNEDLTGHNSTYNIVVKAVSMNVLNKRMTRFSQDAYGARGFRWGITNGIPDHQMNSRKTWKVFSNPADNTSQGLPTSAQTQDTNSVASQDDNATGDSGLYNFIREIYYSEPNRFYLAAASLCRAAVGRPYIKVGLLLSLLGGVPVYKNSVLQRRGNIHCLLVGDSGVGKSFMLRNLCNMMDNALFFSGGSVTASGLTAAAVREKGCSEYTLEAGALVLASGGTCCIDELDKTTTAQQNSLLEAMESQSVSLAKGGIVCTLTAQCTVICAANPSGGRFNTSISVTKNIKLLAPLVSRFDLIFFIADKRSEEADDYIASHILKKDLKRQYSTREVRPEPVSLKDHVTYYRPNEFLDENLLRSYIEYAKAYVNPVFTRPARKRLRKFYSELRQLSKMHNGLVITTRQLEGIIRLCQARARGDLCDRVTEEHVNDVCELFKQTGYYPGYLDTMSRPSEVVEPVKKARPKTAISIMAAFISRLPANRTVTITHQEMMEYARQTLKVCQSERDPRDLIERANLAGHILKKGNNWTVNI